jgi:hypothetical protein
MTNREKLKKAVIMALHPGMSYEEALERELIENCIIEVFEVPDTGSGAFFVHKITEQDEILGKQEIKIFKCGNDILSIDKITGLPITIGRVMQALGDNYAFKYMPAGAKPMVWLRENKWKIINVYWKLVKKNGQECTDDDQTDETINALLKLLP